MKGAYQPKKVGVLGGGQLGKMLLQQAANLDIEMHMLDPDEHAPCSTLTSHFVHGSFQDYQTVLDFGKTCDVITVEIENVNVEALTQLEKEGKQVFPQPSSLKMIKDKGLQKQFYADHNLPTPPFEIYADAQAIQAAGVKPPFVQKLRTGGYDGRGVQIVKTQEDMDQLFDAPSVVEQLVDLAMEISIIVARNSSGEVKCFPAVEMVANEANLLDYLVAPARISKETEGKAQQLATDLINHMGMVGILAVEMFIDRAGNVSINEMAPRPHNSGHHTIEANLCCQYEQHLRAILDLPLGNTDTIWPAAMVNILGEPGFEGDVKYEGLNAALAQPGVFVHLYGKKITRGMRKMGHFTAMAPTLDQAVAIAEDVRKKIKVKT